MVQAEDAAAQQQHHLDAQSDDKSSERLSVPEEQKQHHPQDVSEKETEPAAPSPPGPPGGPPPNGGFTAWLQVLGAWMLFFNTWGVLNEFGVYQTYYESGDLFHETSSNISWIGSIQSIMVLLVGAFVGPIYDRGYLRPLLITGSFLVVFGHMMLSLCSTYWQCLLAQGFVIGIGGGCLFVPSVAIMPTYFSTKIGLAIGLAASGSSMGGVIYPIMFYRLVDRIGFAWTVRVLGFVCLATLTIPVAVMRMRVKPSKPRSIIDWTAFTDVPYIVFTLGAMVGFCGIYVGFFYTSYYGLAKGYTDSSLSFYLVPILNAGSVFGRTIPNWLADKVGPANIITPGAFIVGILLLCMTAVTNAGGLVVNTLFFGFFSGVFIALPPVLFVALTKDKSKIGTRIGMGFGIIAIGVLAGGPGGGGILGDNADDLHWTSTWVYAGVCVLAAGAIFVVVRFMRSPKLVAKV